MEAFIEYYESLCQQKGITDDKDMVTSVTRYTSLKVKDLIKTLGSYKIPSWKDLQADLLQYYNADRSTHQYTLSDLTMFQVREAAIPVTGQVAPLHAEVPAFRGMTAQTR